MSKAFGSVVVAMLLLSSLAAANAAASPAVSSAGAESVALETPAATSAPAGLRDAAAMLLVGTALIGLATAVRRAA
jgi:hypothetical protein